MIRTDKKLLFWHPHVLSAPRVSHDRSGRVVEQKETLHNLGRKVGGPPPIEEWITWVDPRMKEADFHVPATFGWLEFDR